MSLEVSSFYASGQRLPFAGRWAAMPVRQARPLDAGEVDAQWRDRGLLSHEEGYFQLTDDGRCWASNLLHALRTLVGELRQSRPGSL